MKNSRQPASESKSESTSGNQHPPLTEPIMNLFFDMVPDLLCVASADGYFKKLNPAWESALGFTVEELLSRPFIEFIHPDDVEGMIKAIEDHMKGMESKVLINRYRSKDNSYKWFEWQAKANSDGTEFYAVVRDITERKKAEQAFREIEEKYEAAFRTSPDAVNITKMDGTYVDFNKEFTELTGYTREDVIGIPSLDLGIWAIPEDREKLIEGLQKQGSVKNLEFVFRRKDGSLITALMSASLIRINQEPHILSITRDITSRKLSEEAFQVSENRFRQITENSAEMIWEVDIDGMYTYCSEIVRSILGYSVEEVVGHKHFYDFFEPGIREELKIAAFMTFGCKEKFRNFINYNIHKEGQTVILVMNGSPILDKNGKLIGYHGTNTDITSRIMAEKALHESEEKYRLLAVNSSDIIWTMNLDGQFTYVSPSVAQLLGYTPEEVMLHGIYDSLTSESAEIIRKSLIESVQSLQSGEPLPKTTFTLEHLCKDGSTVWTELTLSKLFNDNQQLLGFVGITRNIIERITTEEKLKNSEEIFRTLAEYSPNMIFIIIKNKIYYVNQLCEKKLGYTKEEFYAPDFDFERLAAPTYKKLLKENLLHQTSGKELEPYEFLMTGKDGKELTTMVNTKLIQIGKENAILGVIMDISEQRWAEKILKRKADQFEHFNTLMVDRELKMGELKKEVNHLLEKLGEKAKYNIFEDPSSKNE